MGHSKGSWLQTGNWIGNDDYLVSPSETCYAIMQDDGNFVIYRGFGPENPQGRIWAVDRLPQDSQRFFAIMQSDGNFVVYKGWGPGDNHGVVWALDPDDRAEGLYYVILHDNGGLEVRRGRSPAEDAGPYHFINDGDDIVGMENIVDLQYDLGSAVITDVEQVFLPQGGNALNCNQLRPRYGRWTDLLGLNANEPQRFTIGIPDANPAGPGAVIHAVGQFVWNGSFGNASVQVGLYFGASGSVPTSATATPSVWLATISVPYRMICTVRYRSGAVVERQRVLGTYTGETYYKPQFTVTDGSWSSTVMPTVINFSYANEGGHQGPY